MENEIKPIRKPMRFQGYDYSSPGGYFLTICTAGRRQILSKILDRDDSDKEIFDHLIKLTPIGLNVNQIIEHFQQESADIEINKYVIMPNHIHMIVFILHATQLMNSKRANQTIPKLISSFKRRTNRKACFPIWQKTYYDHILLDEQDYQEKWKYIDDNPVKWKEDEIFGSY